MKILVCTITGHRPTRFKFKYKEDYSLCKKIKRNLLAVFTVIYAQGVRRFYIGGALGVDMWAGEALATMKQQPQFADIELFCALPYPGYDRQWDDKSRKRMERIKSVSDNVQYICQQEQPDAYKKRNYYMVEHSQYLVAVYDQNRSIRSGTGQTVNKALKNNLSILYIHPDTAQITPPLSSDSR